MATIDLITYDQKMVTPKDDALIHQFGISNGVLYGCDVTLADSNTLHITGGQGVIYGRQWEITEGDITVTLPASGSLKGRLYVKIDLSNTTNPIELLVQTDVTLPDLTDDDQINVNNSVSELELYTFDVSSLTISNLVKTVETVADGDHADVVQMQNDISQLNSSLTTMKSRISVNTITLPSDTVRAVSTVSTYREVTLSEKGLYCIISSTNAINYNGRAFACVGGDGVSPYDMMPPTLNANGFTYYEITQFITVTTNTTIKLQYWDSLASGAKHEYKIIKLIAFD